MLTLHVHITESHHITKAAIRHVFQKIPAPVANADKSQINPLARRN